MSRMHPDKWVDDANDPLADDNDLLSLTSGYKLVGIKLQHALLKTQSCLS